MALKRANESSDHESRKAKKTKLDKAAVKPSIPSVPISKLVQEDIDFPRGGGTSLSALEVKNIRSEGLKEADKELFAVRLLHVSKNTTAKDSITQEAKAAKSKARKRKTGAFEKLDSAEKSDKIRVEHLNYKVSLTLERHHLRLTACQFASALSLVKRFLVKSLP